MIISYSCPMNGKNILELTTKYPQKDATLRIKTTFPLRSAKFNVVSEPSVLADNE